MKEERAYNKAKLQIQKRAEAIAIRRQKLNEIKDEKVEQQQEALEVKKQVIYNKQDRAHQRRREVLDKRVSRAVQLQGDSKKRSAS